jgi:hypothetical protein
MKVHCISIYKPNQDSKHYIQISQKIFVTLHYKIHYKIQCNYENEQWIKLNNEMNEDR